MNLCINTNAFAQIWPIENINTVHLDKLNELIERLRKVVLTPHSSIQDMQPKTWKQLSHLDNEFILNLYQKNEDYEKSCELWNILQNTRAQTYIENEDWKSLMEELP